MEFEDIWKDGMNLLLSTIGVPSMLAILGGILIVFGLSEHQPIAFFSGILWVGADYAVYGKEAFDFIEEVKDYIGL
jgi:hypothetical protein